MCQDKGCIYQDKEDKSRDKSDWGRSSSRDRQIQSSLEPHDNSRPSCLQFQDRSSRNNLPIRDNSRLSHSQFQDRSRSSSSPVRDNSNRNDSLAVSSSPTIRHKYLFISDLSHDLRVAIRVSQYLFPVSEAIVREMIYVHHKDQCKEYKVKQQPLMCQEKRIKEKYQNGRRNYLIKDMSVYYSPEVSETEEENLSNSRKIVTKDLEWCSTTIRLMITI
ncbi:3135_t:CDS:2, partial [Racocetra persica]